MRSFCDYDWAEFERTVRFQSGPQRWVALFHYTENICRSGLPGLTVHNGTAIAVPPSCLSGSHDLVYDDTFAALGAPPP